MDIKTVSGKRGKVVVFTILQKQMSHSNAAPLKEKLFLEIADGNHDIVLDLHNVKEMDSSSLGALLFGKRQAGNAGGDLVLAAPSKAVQTIIRIAQLSRVFEMFPTVDEAVAYFEK